MQSPRFVVFLALSWTISLPQAAAREADPDVDIDAADAIAEILASEALVQEDDASAQDARWALREILRQGFAETPTLARTIAAATDDVGFMRRQSFLQTLEREALVGRLRLVPLHQAREAVRRIAFDIPLADHPLVDTYIDYFTGRGRWFFARWLARADRYLPIMQPILTANGLPRDLVYVAMVESGFSASALSQARAAGYWQFIASTGRLYKLRTDVWIDERRDFVRATEAAAAYLGFLYREFGDWHLAWAGYNAGEGRVRRALAKYDARDFWALLEHKGSLAKETMHYVPKIIAAAIVAKDRTKYGFDDITSASPLLYDEIDVEDATELGAVASKFGFEIDELRELNPALLYGVTPPGRPARLRVPAGHGAAVASWLADLPRSERLSYAHHRVKSGDSLYRIAHQHGTTIDAIREFNRIRNARHLRPGQMLIIPVLARRAGPPSDLGAGRTASRRGTTTLASTRGDKPRSNRAAAPKRQPVARHKVAAGETLWSIAQRYGVSVDDVKSWNRRRSNKVMAGEVLQIFAQAEPPRT